MTAAAVSATAGPTALNWMPVADVLAHREGALSQYWYGTERKIDPRWYPGWSVQVSWADRVELGLDNDFSGTTLANLKVSLVDGNKRLPNFALSAGAMNWSGKDVDPYVVARYDLSGLRFHGGWVRTGGASRLMAGVDFPLFAGVTGMIDGTTGPDSVWWFGAAGNVDALPGLNYWLGAGVPTRKSDGTQFGVLVGYYFRL